MDSPLTIGLVLGGSALAILAAMVLRERRWQKALRQALEEGRVRVEAERQQFGETLEREREERSQLERSQRALQAAVETLRLGVTVTDLENKIQYVNPADADMHGYSREELRGRDARIYGYGDRADLDAEAPPARFWDRESVNARRDGSRFPVRLISDVVRNSEDEPIGMLTICEDLSERRAAQRIKEDFLASVSHELRTPLTSIVGALDLLEGRAPDVDPQRNSEMIEIASRNSRRLLRLVDDLLVLQKLRTGRVDFEVQPVPLRPLLESAISDFRPQAGARSIRLELEPDMPETRVLADRDRLLQIVSNLLSNAIKYSPAGKESRVSLSVKPSGARVTLSISDEGPGIPEESLDLLFEPFHRVEDHTHEEGTGLGLSIVKRLVQGMNGAVTVDSEVGRGTTLRVILPTAPDS